MSNRRSRRADWSIGELVEVCVDHRHDLLSDMTIVGPDGHLLQGIYMNGHISSVTRKYVGVDLPAAEATLRFPKEKVDGVQKGKKESHMFVLFDTNIKKVSGLRMTGVMGPTDYYDNLTDVKVRVD